MFCGGKITTRSGQSYSIPQHLVLARLRAAIPEAEAEGCRVESTHFVTMYRLREAEDFAGSANASARGPYLALGGEAK